MRIIFFCFFCFFSFLARAEDSQGVVLPPEKTIEGDYYAFGDSITVSGRVQGNAYLFGTQVSINGEIEEDLFVVAGTLAINGIVHGKIWAVAGEFWLGGSALNGVFLLTANVDLPSSGTIKGNTFVCAGNSDISGQIIGDLKLLSSNVKISGKIIGDVRGFTGKLKVLFPARITGELRYRSTDVASIASGTQIDGGIVYEGSLLKDMLNAPVIKGLIIGSKVAGFCMNFFYTFVMGIILIKIFHQKLLKTLFFLQSEPVRSLIYGIVLVILFPLASLLLLVTVIGAPFALTLMALNVVSFYTAKVFVIIWAGNYLFSRLGMKKNGIMVLFCGQIVYSIAVAIPFVGPFFALIAMILGLGSLVIGQSR